MANLAGEGLVMGTTVGVNVAVERLLARRLTATIAKQTAAKVATKAAQATATKVAAQAATKMAGGITMAVGIVGLGLDVWDPLDLANPLDASMLDTIWKTKKEATAEAFAKIKVCRNPSYTTPQAADPLIICPAGPTSCVAVYSGTEPPADDVCSTIPTPTVLRPEPLPLNKELPSLVTDGGDLALLHAYVDEQKTTLFDSPADQVEFDSIFNEKLVNGWIAAGRPDPAPPSEIPLEEQQKAEEETKARQALAATALLLVAAYAVWRSRR
jgi:hypothetical protein